MRARMDYGGAGVHGPGCLRPGGATQDNALLFLQQRMAYPDLRRESCYDLPNSCDSRPSFDPAPHWTGCGRAFGKAGAVEGRAEPDSENNIHKQERVMQTIEIAGRPTVVVPGSKDDVQGLLDDEAFFEDLLIFETEGKPLWSGDRKDLFVRGAFEDEISKWEKTFAQARLDGDATDEDRDSYIVFLVPITDPTEDEH
jgi:hypothetical protein